MERPVKPEHPLRVWRRANSKTQSQLAERLGVSGAQISRYENGKETIPPEKAIEIEKAIGIPRKVIRPDIFDTRALVYDLASLASVKAMVFHGGTP